MAKHKEEVTPELEATRAQIKGVKERITDLVSQIDEAEDMGPIISDLSQHLNTLQGLNQIAKNQLANQPTA